MSHADLLYKLDWGCCEQKLNTMKTKIIYVLLMCSISFFSSCKKEVVGPQGPTGQTGKSGVDGNANVKSLTYNITAWQQSGNSFIITLNCPIVTQEIIDNGAVLVYFDYVGKNYQLPLTLYFNNYQEIIDYNYSLGSVVIQVVDSDLTLPNNPGNHTAKVVAMTANGLKKINDNHLNIKDYNAVAKALNILN